MQMAQGKKSFILYADYIHIADELDDETAGQLFKHLLRYVNDQNPEPPNQLVSIAFVPIKQQLKRDLVKWEGIREKKSAAGKASAQARKGKNQQMSTGVKSVQQSSTESTVNVNVTVNDTVKEYNTYVKKCFDTCLEFFPKQLFPKKEKAWLDVIDKLTRIDKYSVDEIVEVVKWAREDDFWSSNFLSLVKLRKKNSSGIPYILVFKEKMNSKTNNNERNSQKSRLDKFIGG